MSQAILLGEVNFSPLVGNFYALGWGSGSRTSEPPVNVKWRTAGTLSGFYAFVDINSNTAGTDTLVLRKNSANGNQLVSILNGITGNFSDSVNTDSVVSGDLICGSTSTNATGGSMFLHGTSVLFDSAAGLMMKFVNLLNLGLSGAAQAFVFFPVGNVFTTTEANSQFRVRTTGTLQKFQVSVSTNTRTDTTTFRVRKNTANGNQLISVTTTQTGYLEDPSNTDGVVSGDLINYNVLTGADGAHNMIVDLLAAEFVTTNLQNHFILSLNTTLSAGLTRYEGISGVGALSISSEPDSQLLAQSTYTLSNMTAFVSANTLGASSTLQLRKNTANGNQVKSIGAGSTGFFEDAVNTDSLVATDEVNYKIVAGAGGTQIAFTMWGLLYTLPNIPLAPFVSDLTHAIA